MYYGSNVSLNYTEIEGYKLTAFRLFGEEFDLATVDNDYHAINIIGVINGTSVTFKYIDTSVADEDKEKIVQSVKALVEDNGGSAQEPERWGVRKYAYPINYKQEGYYVLMNFEADDALPKKMNDKLKFFQFFYK